MCASGKAGIYTKYRDLTCCEWVMTNGHIAGVGLTPNTRSKKALSKLKDSEKKATADARKGTF